MKLSTMVFLILLGNVAFAQDIYLNDYNSTVTDIARKRISKEQVFQSMERDFIKLGSSICSNRALIWAYDMKRNFQITTAKMFLFYADTTGTAGQKVWWYHVTPLVNENGKLWALDAGFPGFVKQPLLPKDWLEKFSGSSNCKEIQNSDSDLIELIFTERRFPSVTRYGKFDCYYRITSESYWTPDTVARNLLQRDSRGQSGNYYRDTILPAELMQACVEASSTPIGGIFTNRKKKCLEYLGINE